MKSEISAGGLVVRKHEACWEVLLIRDMNGQWTFPKGIIEQGEHPQSAAVREIFEETGLSDVVVRQALDTVSYEFTRQEPVKKTVYYFLCDSKGADTLANQKEEGISEVGWFLLSKAKEMIGYKQTNLPLLNQAQQALETAVV